MNRSILIPALLLGAIGTVNAQELPPEPPQDPAEIPAYVQSLPGFVVGQLPADEFDPETAPEVILAVAGQADPGFNENGDDSIDDVKSVADNIGQRTGGTYDLIVNGEDGQGGAVGAARGANDAIAAQGGPDAIATVTLVNDSTVNPTDRFATLGNGALGAFDTAVAEGEPTPIIDFVVASAPPVLVSGAGAVVESVTTGSPDPLADFVDGVTNPEPEVGNDFVQPVEVAITGTFNAVCAFSADTLDFGEIELSALEGQPLLAETNLNVSCTPGVEYTITNETPGETLLLDLDTDSTNDAEVTLYRDDARTQDFGNTVLDDIDGEQSLEDHDNGDLFEVVYAALHAPGDEDAAPLSAGAISGVFNLRLEF